MAAVIILTCCMISTWMERYVTSSPYQQTLKQLGLDYFEQQRYDEAYRLFVALDHLGYPPEWCLHYQIQCLFRLHRLQQAIQHCRYAINRQPLGRWYLALLDLHLHIGQHDLALSIVRTAVTLLDQSDPDWDDLSWKEQWLLQQQSTTWPVAQDFVGLLPCELVTKVFQQLALPDLARCTTVSRAWYQFIHTTPLLWQHMTIQTYQPRLHASTLKLYLKRLQGTPLLSLRVRTHLDGNNLLSLLCQTNCSQLSVIELLGPYYATGYHTTTKFHKIVSLASTSLRELKIGSSSFRLNEIFALVTQHCPNLELLSVYDCFTSLGSSLPNANLHHLDPGANQRLELFGQFVSPAFLEYLRQFDKQPRLKQLSLTRVHGLTILPLALILLSSPNLYSLTLDACLVNIIPVINILLRACSGLRHFFYHRNQFSALPLTSYAAEDSYNDLSSWPILSPVVEPPKLDCLAQGWKYLVLRETRVLNDALLHYLLRRSYPTIEHLDLQGHHKLTDQALLRSLPRAPMASLRHCVLSQCINLTEYGLCTFLEQCSDLRVLHLAGLSAVTDRVLQVIARRCVFLLELNLSHCRSISDQGLRSFIDALLYAKRAQSLPLHLKDIQLVQTNISLDCFSRVMAHIQRDGV
ncbi:RNI-like protein [Hesseltinella vesiculosa]|uniref:RNI-like protein n=1 Tax=Hesseltinella vesiculosa TaxID=101127 RepID=A0A1X2GG20_9FUNG|nr:RNI-like protein [Hesseltinella vesiculosa]